MAAGDQKPVDGSEVVARCSLATSSIRKGYCHSDQGSWYGSDGWQDFLKAHDPESSMSRRRKLP
jgi:transposase InsO family protein